MAEDNKDERIENLEEKVVHLSRMLVKSFSYAGQDPDTFLQNARRTTEAICRFLYVKEIGEPKGKLMLNDLGRELASRKVVPDRIGILIGTIQTYGNYAAHAQEDMTESTREWIAPCQTALAGLTNWFFLDYLKGDIPDELASTIKTYADVSTIKENAKPIAGESKKYFYVIGLICLLVAAVIASYLVTKNDTIPLADTKTEDPESVSSAPENAVDSLNKITPATDAKRIAVIYFDSPDDNTDLTRLRKGLADMLISDMSKIKMLNVVERSRLEEILKEQRLNNSTEFDPHTATRLGKLLGVEYILTGSFFEIMGKLRIDARIIQVETGKIVKSEGVDGDTPQFFDLEKQLLEKIVIGLQVDLPASVVARADQTTSISYEASLRYSEGLELMDKGRHEEALAVFNRVLASYPDFLPAKEVIQQLTGNSL